jgi:hypothetical protein
MLEIFKKKNKRVRVDGTNIFIDNKTSNVGRPTALDIILKLKRPIPLINVYEDNILVRCFTIETIQQNPDLSGQYLHCSIRIHGNSSVMIDGIISISKTELPKWSDKDYEAIRLQPFYLSNAENENKKLTGTGLFNRGLHYTGIITPSGVRNICVCDSCNKSFSLQHFHAGFSEVQYFYSAKGSETLIVPYNAIEGMPKQLEKYIDVDLLSEVEEKLPKDVVFKYYNSLKCPHCSTPFIDFEKHKEIRPNEYYGNTLINQKPRLFTT